MIVMGNRKPNGNAVKTSDGCIYKDLKNNSHQKFLFGYVLSIDELCNNEHEIKFTDEPPVKEESRQDQIYKLAMELSAVCAISIVDHDSAVRRIAGLIADGKFTNVKWVGK